jgi:hypothetical protein
MIAEQLLAAPKWRGTRVGIVTNVQQLGYSHPDEEEGWII